jgi:hypothetical protein
MNTVGVRGVSIHQKERVVIGTGPKSKKPKISIRYDIGLKIALTTIVLLGTRVFQDYPI